MSAVDRISTLPTLNPDSVICGFDGNIAVHSFLLKVHSNLLSEMCQSIQESSEITLILPDFSAQEIKSFVHVMYGLDNSGLVSGSFLKTLGIFELQRSRIECSDGVMAIFGGPLEGFRLIDPTKSYYLPISPRESSVIKSPTEFHPQTTVVSILKSPDLISVCPTTPSQTMNDTSP